MVVFFKQSLNDHRESPAMETNAMVGVQHRRSVELQSEALPVGEHENSEVDIGGTAGEHGIIQCEHCNMHVGTKYVHTIYTFQHGKGTIVMT